MRHPLAIPGVLGLLAALPAAQVAPGTADPRRTPVVEVVERVKPAVVSIATEVRTQSWFGIRDQAGPVGTGVVIFEDGYIITNNHVVAGASRIQVTFDEADDPTVYDAVPISSDTQADLALIKIEGTKPFTTVTLCENEAILAEPVIAIGNAFKHSHTVSTGIVSGLHRAIQTGEGQSFENLLQTDASINPGNSGGPLLNINGELIGINSAMQGMAENIGFAIPVSQVRRVLSEQLLSPSQAPTWLGYEVDEQTFTVTSIVPGGPAARAGLQPGDRLSALAGHLLTSLEGDPIDVYRRVRLSIQPGRRVVLRAQRDGREQEFTLDGWNRIDGLLFQRLGLRAEVIRLGARPGRPYLRVTDVRPESPAATAGLQPGDLLTGIQRERWEAPRWFQRVEDLAYLVSVLPPGSPLQVEVYRDDDGDQVYLEVDPRTGYSERYTGTITLP